MSAAAHRLRGIYAIVGESGPDPVVLGRQLFEGGIRIVQYRAKNKLNANHANALRALANQYDALFILNDAWRAVDEFDADGVHLGPDDVRSCDLLAVREQLRGRIIGLSCGTPEEALQAQRLGADYIGVGCVYPTRSKADAGEPIGIAGLRCVAAASSLPVAAIGGITVQNLPAVAASGVAMAALLSELATSAEPAALARRLVNSWPA